MTTGRKERISEIFKISLARGQEVKPRECPKVKVDTSPENPESVNLHLRQVGKDLKSEFGDEAIKATALKRSPSDSESATFKGKNCIFLLKREPLQWVKAKKLYS